jgi:hypothetical protein
LAAIAATISMPVTDKAEKNTDLPSTKRLSTKLM